MLHEKLKRILRVSAQLAVVTGVLGFSALAQTTFGTVVGNVTDQSGAALPNATVKLTNNGTNESRTMQTTMAGIYSFVNLNPGSYKVEVEAKGFKSFRRDVVSVEVGGTLRVDASLPIGDTAESVVVSGEAIAIQTDSSSLGNVVSTRAIEDAPLSGRNVNNILMFVPGVVAGGSTSGNAVGNSSGGTRTNPIGFGNYQIGGGFSGQSIFYIDGVLSNIPSNNMNPLIPTQDSVQEFRVATNNVSAEFGGFAGGVVNISTKSGTNEFHGSLYDYFRNKSLNANNFFSNRNGLPRPPLSQNQFGITAGGPVQRNKTFFFFGWEKEFVRSGTLLTATEPSAAMLAGDFSAPGLPVIYDPTTGQPFPGNIIPPNRLDPSSVKISSLFLPPNRPGSTNNFVVTAPAIGDQNQYNARVDHSFGSKNQFFSRYTYWTAQSPGSAAKPGFTAGTIKEGNLTHSAVLGDTHIINPTTVVDARVSFLRNYFADIPLAVGAIDMAQFGPAYGALQKVMGQSLNPALTIPNPTYGTFGGMNSQLYWTTNMLTVSGSLTKIAGRHTIKVGVLARDVNYYDGANSQGVNMTFSELATRGASAPTSGYSLASFLLGIPVQSSITQVGGGDNVLHNYGLYATDTFQVNRKLTLNLGLRWEQPGAYSEKHDWTTGFLANAPDPLGSIVNPLTGAAQPLVGQLALVKTPAYPDSTVQQLHWNLFSPRVGFAYRITDQTVIRAGYGISYPPATLSQNRATGSPINSAGTTLINSGSILTTVSNPFPNGINQPIRRSGSIPALVAGQSISTWVPSQPAAYVQQWNFAIERGIKDGTFSIAYAGSKGTHLTLQGGGTSSTVNLNALPDKYFSLGSALLTPVPNPFFGKIAAGTLSTPTIQQGFLLKPFPQYINVSRVSPNLGDSSYQALQSSFRQRVRGGGQIMVAYTWSKLIANTDSIINFLDTNATTGSVQNPNNLAGERSLSSYDTPHNLVLSYGVDLPFGHGQRFLANGGFADKLVSGWRLSGIGSFQAGTPLALVAGSVNSLNSTFGLGTIRPNVVAGCDAQVSGSAQTRIYKWFNPACYTAPGQFALGNESRTDAKLRTAGNANWDMSVSKITPLTEKVQLQFTTEFYNLFNRVRFGPPANNLSSAATVGVVTSQANQPRAAQFSLRLRF